MMNSSNNNTNNKKLAAASIGGGKTARACDGCVKRRARWYCAADDAFLCQACDNSVHSANSLARRHERVRLKTSSSTSSPPPPYSLPAWHHGFTRKARTPRNNNNNPKHVPAPREPPSLPLVPEIFADAKTTSQNDGDDESLLYRVPTFNDDAIILVGNSSNNNNNSSSVSCAAAVSPEIVNGPPATETDLTVDVESLLGRGLETECDFGIEGLGFVEKDYSFDDGRVKIKLDYQPQQEEEEEEEDDDGDVDMKMCWSEASAEMDMLRPPELFEDYEESPAVKPKKEPGEELEECVIINKKKSNKSSGKNKNNKNNKKKKNILLRLDYDGVITAWASQGSPWTAGDRPDLDPEAAAWPDDHDCMGTYTAHQLPHHHFMNLSGIGGTPAILADGGREARVSRYREKRQTRLFSKKIRYEVRKLNAEKRPRMKGRFVKRASFVGPHFPMLK